MLSQLTALSVLATLALAAPLTKRATTTAKIQGNNGQCLGYSGSTSVYDGTPLGGVDCNSESAIQWVFTPQSPSSITPLGHSDFALDAGTNPEDFGKLKLWTSYPGLYQQTWYYTADNRVAIYNGNQCLDDGNDMQLYQCTTGNTNQVYTALTSGGGGSPSSSAPSCPTPTPTPSTSTSTSQEFTSGGMYTITVKDCAPGGGGEGCEVVQPTPTAGNIVATVTLT